MQSPKNTSPETIDTFYVLDFDRCLGNTDKLGAVLQNVIQRELTIHPDVLDKARREYERTGGSFDTATYVKQLIERMGRDGELEWSRLEAIFVRECQSQNMLEPFAAELLHMLTRKNTAFGIVTFGGEAWQRAKLQASGLTDVPYMVTQVKQKGRILGSWQQSEGGFSLPLALTRGRQLVARSLVFIDDSPISFIGIPAEVTAVCAIPPTKIVPQDSLAALPSSVAVVQGLDGAIELLFSH